jgi:hypothetical protein
MAQGDETMSADLTVPPPMPEPDSYRRIGSPLYQEQVLYTAEQIAARDAIWLERIASLLRAVPPVPVVAWTSRDAHDMEQGRLLAWDKPATGEPEALTYKADADAALASLQARLEAAERDAARYRWLRAGTTAGRSLPGSPASFNVRHVRAPADVMRGSVAQHLDAAIDAATSQENGGTTTCR